jgi:hypothetical protein
MYPHRMRLHGPWECEPFAVRGDTPLPPPRRMVPPACLRDSGLAGFAGRVRLVRRFGYPGRIDSYEHVWLTLAEVVGRADIAVNGHALGTEQTGEVEFEITRLLEARNRLEIVLDADTDAAGLVGEIALEIRRDAFLRNVAAGREDTSAIRVSGLVVGQSAMPLELYGRADGQNVFYSVIAAKSDGEPFDIAFTPQGTPENVQVELVCGAERWHAVEAPVTRL